MTALSRLGGKQFNGYLKIKLPHDLDAVVDSAVDAYRGEDASRRQQMIDETTLGVAGVLSAYGQRMAAVAVRAQSPVVLERALLAVGIAQGRLQDPRDNLYPLAAINHSATLLGTDLGQVIDRVATLLPAPAVQALRAFASRAERDKSLRAMGLGTAGQGAEFRYVSA